MYSISLHSLKWFTTWDLASTAAAPWTMRHGCSLASLNGEFTGRQTEAQTDRQQGAGPQYSFVWLSVSNKENCAVEELLGHWFNLTHGIARLTTHTVADTDCPPCGTAAAIPNVAWKHNPVAVMTRITTAIKSAGSRIRITSIPHSATAVFVYEVAAFTVLMYCSLSPCPHFYSARNARIASAVLATAIPSVCPSFRPSHAGIVSKRHV